MGDSTLPYDDVMGSTRKEADNGRRLSVGLAFAKLH